MASQSDGQTEVLSVLAAAGAEDGAPTPHAAAAHMQVHVLPPDTVCLKVPPVLPGETSSQGTLCVKKNNSSRMFSAGKNLVRPEGSWPLNFSYNSSS